MPFLCSFLIYYFHSMHWYKYFHLYFWQLKLCVCVSKFQSSRHVPWAPVKKFCYIHQPETAFAFSNCPNNLLHANLTLSKRFQYSRLFILVHPMYIHKSLFLQYIIIIWLDLVHFTANIPVPIFLYASSLLCYYCPDI